MNCMRDNPGRVKMKNMAWLDTSRDSRELQLAYVADIQYTECHS